MKAETDEDPIKLTQQFRHGDAMVYEFRSRTARLTLRVSGRGGDKGPPTEWRIEASISSSPDSLVVGKWELTRAEALRVVGRMWGDKRRGENRPVFDWESVARAMSAVRAI